MPNNSFYFDIQKNTLMLYIQYKISIKSNSSQRIQVSGNTAPFLFIPVRSYLSVHWFVNLIFAIIARAKQTHPSDPQSRRATVKKKASQLALTNILWPLTSSNVYIYIYRSIPQKLLLNKENSNLSLLLLLKYYSNVHISVIY